MLCKTMLGVERDLQVRAWGAYTVLHPIDSIMGEVPGIKTKVLEIDDGHVIPMQHHRLHDEVWFVVEGEGQCNIGGEVRSMRPGMIFDIPRGVNHEIEGVEGLKFVEIQVPYIIPGEDAVLVEGGQERA